MDQLGGTRGGLAGKIALVDKRNAQPANRRVARDRGTVDTAANYGDVEGFTAQSEDLFVAREMIVPHCGRNRHPLFLGFLLERVALLQPWIGAVMVAAHLPEAADILGQKFDCAHPLGALPGV